MSKQRNHFRRVLIALTVLFALIAALACAMARFGALAEGEAPGLFGLALYGVGQEAAPAAGQEGGVLLVRTLRPAKTASLAVGDEILYLPVGAMPDELPQLGVITALHGDPGSSAAYSIAPLGSEGGGEMTPALMIRAKLLCVLRGAGPAHAFLWGRKGVLPAVVLPAALLCVASAAAALITIRRGARRDSDF